MMNEDRALNRSSPTSSAFQLLCHRFFKGIFYRQGNFIGFGDAEEKALLEGLESACGGRYAAAVQESIGMLGARGLGGNPRFQPSDRLRSMNRFRAVVGAIAFNWELGFSRNPEAEKLLESWFAPPPYWLLRYYDQYPKRRDHLSRINPNLAQMARRAPDPAARYNIDQFCRAVRVAFGPSLFRRHHFFWLDRSAEKKLDPRGKKTPSLVECAKALPIKLEHSWGCCVEELDKLEEALRTKRSPHDVNTLVFQFLAWIAWSDPPSVLDDAGEQRRNPRFEPIGYFITQKSSQFANRTWIRLSDQAKQDRSLEGIQQDLVERVLTMFQADQVRGAINLNSKICTALDNEAKKIMKELRDHSTVAARTVRLRENQDIDQLTRRKGEQSIRETLERIDEIPEARAKLQEFVETRWEDIRKRVATHLEERLDRVKLPTELRDQLAGENPLLLELLPDADGATLMRWYYLEALGYDSDELRKEFRTRQMMLSDGQMEIWFDELLETGPSKVDRQREDLEKELDALALRWSKEQSVQHRPEKTNVARRT